jgi:hypothetical protein
MTVGTTPVAVDRARGGAMKRAPLHYSMALETLRSATFSSKEIGVVALLIRAALASEAAGETLVKMPLKTRAQRREGVIAAAIGIINEVDCGDPDTLSRLKRQAA